MKKIFYIILMIAGLSVSCSSGDDESNSAESEIAQKLIGEWGEYYGSEEKYLEKKLNFRSDAVVEYYTYPNGDEPTIGDIGEWSLDDDILTMEFPQGFLIIFVQKVVFTNDDNTVQFLDVEGSDYDSFEIYIIELNKSSESKVMRNLPYIFLLSVMSLSISCSSDDNNNSSEDLLPLKEYKITINGVIDGDYANFPNPTNNSFIATYIKDDANEIITYTEALTNELNIEKTKNISARYKVGIVLNINQPQTTLYYIKIKIEDLTTNTLIYENQISKGLVSSNPGTYSTTEIKALYDVELDSTTLSL